MGARWLLVVLSVLIGLGPVRAVAAPAGLLGQASDVRCCPLCSCGDQCPCAAPSEPQTPQTQAEAPAPSSPRAPAPARELVRWPGAGMSISAGLEDGPIAHAGRGVVFARLCRWLT